MQMDKNYIDVDYIECHDENKPQQERTFTNNSPISTVVHEVVSSVSDIANNVVSSIKEYSICRQQEQTKRAEIRAYLKLGLAEINARTEILIKQLDNRHEYEMELIKDTQELLTKQLDAIITTINAAVITAQKSGDFSGVIELLKTSQEVVNSRSQITLQLMDKINSCESVMAISAAPRGYLE